MKKVYNNLFFVKVVDEYLNVKCSGQLLVKYNEKLHTQTF